MIQEQECWIGGQIWDGKSEGKSDGKSDGNWVSKSEVTWKVGSWMDKRWEMGLKMGLKMGLNP